MMGNSKDKFVNCEVFKMKPMLPSLAFEIPKGKDWLYEIKYDGFRAILHWEKEISLTSRNGKPLLPLVPEIRSFLEKNEENFRPFLPLIFDGELVALENIAKANFSAIQVRGRMRSENRILEKAKTNPCHLLIFDAIVIKGKSLHHEDYLNRKKQLTALFTKCMLPLEPDPSSVPVQLIPFFHSFDDIWNKVVLYDGEGVVAKHATSKWMEGKRTNLWIKYKNWKYVICFITAFEKSNGYFYVGVYNKEEISSIGQFLFGLKRDEKSALLHAIKQNKSSEDWNFIYIEPSICVELKYLELYEGQMREPHFHQFKLDYNPKECTIKQFVEQQKNLPPYLNITHPDKPLWENPAINKSEFIHYLREISPYMLPFLKERLLTVIRYPHGIFGEPFYQKNCPDYSPSFIKTAMHDDINYIVCNDLNTLLWLGNQLAFEYHIPFQKIGSKSPSEIVFDLDPPSRGEFGLAIKASLYIKEILNELNLIGFIKTSGNKGLQIYLPLPENRYSYEETRLFTAFIAEYLVAKDPRSFTIERMKKNRGNRLYIDYIQHAEGKTIIAPYSPRGTNEATVATPLYWEEINNKLKIEHFQIPTIINRINSFGDPFRTYVETKETQNLTPVLDFLKNKT